MFIAIKPGVYTGQDGFTILHPSAARAHAVYEGQVAATFRRCGRGVRIHSGKTHAALNGVTVLDAAMDWCHTKAAS